MIVKTSVVILLLSVAWIKEGNGAAYSKVFLERAVAPVEYYQYGPPSLSSAHLSQINSAPVQFSVPSVSSMVPPCGSPCIIPGQTVASVAPSANVLTYNSPISNVPIVITSTNDEPLGYEYSYVVYDENTGDHKAQRELSDGSVVRGEYSFLQPDGYVREVQYVADDISGFNAIVKNYLPVAVEGKKKVEVVEKKEASLPCHDVKNESIKEGSEKESGEVSKEKLGNLKVHHEIKQSKKNSSEATKEESEEHKESTQYSTLKESGEISEELEEPQENSKEKHETIHTKEYQEKSKESEEFSKEKNDKTLNKESEEKSKEKPDEMQNTVSKESSDDKSEEKPKGKSHKKSNKESKESESDSKGKSNEEFEELKEILHADHENHLTPLNHDVTEPEHETLVSYHDIIHCIQAAISRANEMPAAQREEPSPLTYIILNKPC